MVQCAECISPRHSKVESSEPIKDLEVDTESNIPPATLPSCDLEEKGGVDKTADTDIAVMKPTGQPYRVPGDEFCDLESGFWYRFGEFVLRYPVLFLIGSVGFLVAFTVVFFVKVLLMPVPSTNCTN